MAKAPLFLWYLTFALPVELGFGRMLYELLPPSTDLFSIRLSVF
jgi:hypothetical protein